MLAAQIFLFLCAIYLLTYSGVITISDEVSIMATAESLTKRGEFTSNQTFSKFRLNQVNLDTLDVIPTSEPLQALLSVPLVWTAVHVPHLGVIHFTTLLNV